MQKYRLLSAFIVCVLISSTPAVAGELKLVRGIKRAVHCITAVPVKVVKRTWEALAYTGRCYGAGGDYDTGFNDGAFLQASNLGPYYNEPLIK